MSIEWRAAPGWPEYEVSEYGGIRRAKAAQSTKTGRIRQHQIGTSGYPQLNLSSKGITKTQVIHTLVALAFLGDPPTPRHMVTHIDGVKLNNHYSNLQWVTEKAKPNPQPKGQTSD